MFTHRSRVIQTLTGVSTQYAHLGMSTWGNIAPDDDLALKLEERIHPERYIGWLQSKTVRILGGPTSDNISDFPQHNDAEYYIHLALFGHHGHYFEFLPSGDEKL